MRVRGIRGRVLLGAVLISLGACQSSPERPDGLAERMEAMLEAGAASQPPPAEVPREVAAALLPPLRVDAGPAAPESEGQRFELTVRDAPAQQFFMSLVQDTPFNMVVHPDVAGAVTLDLKNVTIPEVMEIVRNVYGYEFQRTSYGFEVLPARLRSRVYQVNFLNLLRSGTSRTRVSSGQVSQANPSLDEDTGVIDPSADQGRVSGTEINTAQPETTIWLELEASIRTILGDTPGRTVVVSPQSGVVVVRAMPLELREVEEYLRTTQAIASRQVILEAKILEVELNDAYRQGINWSAVFRVGSSNKPITFSQVGGRSVIEDGTSLNRNDLNVGSLDPDLFVPAAGSVFTPFGGMFSAALALTDFNAFIELLDSQGTVHVLSSPRIATMNNQKAVIKVGSDEFFVTEISSTTVTGTTTTTTPSVELTPFFSGIALDVTPQISEAGDVLLHVHPAISEVTDQQKLITVGTTPQILPLAFSTVRESDSIVRARSGQVVVIGGLMEDRVSNDSSQIPGLGEAPGVGNLFRHRAEATTRSELVILLRPVVVESGDQWADMMRGTAGRLRGIRQQAYPPAPAVN